MCDLFVVLVENRIILNNSKIYLICKYVICELCIHYIIDSQK